MLFTASGKTGYFPQRGSVQLPAEFAYCDEDLGLSLDSFSARFIAPTIKLLLASVPDGGQISAEMLHVPDGVEAACERLSGVAMRFIMNANVNGPVKMGRFDITVEPRA